MSKTIYQINKKFPCNSLKFYLEQNLRELCHPRSYFSGCIHVCAHVHTHIHSWSLKQPPAPFQSGRVRRSQVVSVQVWDQNL